MQVYAIIDTNVIVSALIAKGKNTPPHKVISAIDKKQIIPILHNKIVCEYIDVINRPKFTFPTQDKQELLKRFYKFAKFIEPIPYPFALIDEKDRIFFEVCLTARKQFKNTYLITGNKKHFPQESFVASPLEIVRIIEIIKNR